MNAKLKKDTIYLLSYLKTLMDKNHRINEKISEEDGSMLDFVNNLLDEIKTEAEAETETESEIESILNETWTELEKEVVWTEDDSNFIINFLPQWIREAESNLNQSDECAEDKETITRVRRLLNLKTEPETLLTAKKIIKQFKNKSEKMTFNSCMFFVDSLIENCTENKLKFWTKVRSTIIKLEINPYV